MTISADADLHALIGSWELDPQRTAISFRSRLLRIPFAKGALRATEGRADVDRDGNATGILVIDVGSITSRISKRDDHLRSADLFDAERYPTITFTVDTVSASQPGTVDVSGVVRVRDRDSPVTVTGTLDVNGDSATLSATLPIDDSVLHIHDLRLLKSSVAVAAHFSRT